jgi:hypothetical protein
VALHLLEIKMQTTLSVANGRKNSIGRKETHNETVPSAPVVHCVSELATHRHNDVLAIAGNNIDTKRDLAV